MADDEQDQRGWWHPGSADDGSTHQPDAEEQPAPRHAAIETGPAGSNPSGSRRRAPRRAMSDAHFRRTMTLTVAGTLVPGLGLIAAGRRVAGGIILAVFIGAIAVVVGWALSDPQGLTAMAVRPAMLNGLAVALIVLSLAWVGVVVATHLALRHTPNHFQRLTGGALVGVLAFAVAAPMAVAARYSYDQASLVSAVFKSEKDTKSATRPSAWASNQASEEPDGTQPSVDPWEKKPRLNLLLLGGDAGKGRTGTRTDTVIVASIDTATGNTTLVSLPRNTGRMPFPQDSPLHDRYPYGFTDGDGNNPEYFLNAMYDNVPNSVPKDVLGETDNLGADVMKLSVGEATGLDIDYYVEINLAGFEKMINALGGIKVNINTYIPIGGNTDLGIPPSDYLEPGPDQHLKGREALWYARGRYGSDDFARMDRQRCVIDAIIKQANPANMLARYEEIAKAGKEIVKTDMPQEVLPLMVDLSLRVKDGNVRSIVFKHGVDGFSSPNPDFSMMRKRVKTAIGETKKEKPSPSPTTTKKAKKAKESTAPKSDDDGDKASDDIEDSCAYQPSVAATAQPAR
ncbi:MAG TPA: LCP family protein [Microlunatus sp.]|nr:LCP family protein [Microlunatus sp.]